MWVSRQWGVCRHLQWERPGSHGNKCTVASSQEGRVSVGAHLPVLVPVLPVQALGCQTTHSNQEVLQGCSLVFLATKPHVLPAVLAEVAPVVTPEHILVSVAAGVSLSSLEEVSGHGEGAMRLQPGLSIAGGGGGVRGAVAASLQNGRAAQGG